MAELSGEEQRSELKKLLSEEGLSEETLLEILSEKELDLVGLIAVLRKLKHEDRKKLLKILKSKKEWRLLLLLLGLLKENGKEKGQCKKKKRLLKKMRELLKLGLQVR